MQFLLKTIPAILILLLGYWAWNHLSTPEEEEKKAKPKRTPEQVQKMKLARAQQTKVTTLRAIDYPVTLDTQGIVRAPAITSLTPQVAGIITTISEAFENGAFFKKGDILLELDPADFESQIVSAQANLARAEASLAQEQARAAQALRNWLDIGFKDTPNDLVLRKPQLKEAQANVAAQQAALDRAQRNLQRSKIRAPYDGRVRIRNVGPGQSVGSSTKLGEIFSTAYAEVRLPLSARQLKQIDINEKQLGKIPVTLVDALNPSDSEQWEAHLVRVEGELDPTSRELFVIARIDDPFGLLNPSQKSPLRINLPVQAKIKARSLPNAILIPRSALYGENDIILVTDNKIHRHSISIVWSTIDQVVTQDTLLEGATLATSKLAYAPEGSLVRVIPTEAPPAEASSSTSDQTLPAPSNH